jgi:hypothetical protein
MAVMVIMFIWSIGYFCWRGCKRAKQKIAKKKMREEIEKMSEFERGVLERRR